MKKCFYALTAALLALTSCSSQEEPVMEAGSGEVTTVTLSLALPGQPQSRATQHEVAYGDASMVDKIEYAVYDSKNQLVLKSSDSGAAVVEKKGELYYSVDLQLLREHEYTVICWASATNSPYTFNPELNGVTVSVDYSKVEANNEACDAFFGKRKITVAHTQGTNNDLYAITLGRPFAQVNVVTNDIDVANKFFQNGNDIASVSVIMKDKPAGKYNTLSLLGNGVIASNPETNVTYKVEYTNYSSSKKRAAIMESGQEFYYLSTCYLLTGIESDGTMTNGHGTKSETTDIEIVITDKWGESIHYPISNLPIKRNWRTNIFGNLLSTDAKIDIRLDREFSGSDNYTSDGMLHSGDSKNNNKPDTNENEGSPEGDIDLG